MKAKTIDLDAPPIPLGAVGEQHYRAVLAECAVDAYADRMQLAQACAALERAEEIAALLRKQRRWGGGVLFLWEVQGPFSTAFEGPGDQD